MKSVVGQFVVDRAGRKKGIIISVAKYRRLLEDLHDLAIVAERRKEKTITLEEMRRRLGAHARV